MAITEEAWSGMGQALIRMEQQEQIRLWLARQLVEACNGRDRDVERFIYKALSMWNEQADQQKQEESK